MEATQSGHSLASVVKRATQAQENGRENAAILLRNMEAKTVHF